MYTSTSINTSINTSQPIEAWRHEKDPGAIWFGSAGGGVMISMSLVETQQLIAELQRELAAVEAMARGTAA